MAQAGPIHSHTTSPHHQHTPHTPYGHPQESKLNSITATTTQSSASSESGKALSSTQNNPPLDSWEDIEDEPSSSDTLRQPQPVPAESAIKEVVAVDKMVEKTVPQEDPVVEDKIPVLETPPTSATSSSSSINSTSSSNKKIPSPNLSKGSKLESSKVNVSAPPPKTEDDKENINVIFIGHVGKKRMCYEMYLVGGEVEMHAAYQFYCTYTHFHRCWEIDYRRPHNVSLMCVIYFDFVVTIVVVVRYLTGQVDKRTLEKYEREAREKNRETWYLSWALDTNQEERDKVIVT